MWHPVSYGTQFTNNTLTIAVNGLSLDKDWYDPGTNRDDIDARSLQIAA
ncbi:hypothetical protein ACFX2J_045690 [Malus domestica]